MSFISYRTEDKARKIYDLIEKDIVSARKTYPEPQPLTVLISCDDVSVDGFWSRIYEDCVAGIAWAIQDDTKNLIHGRFPLHKAPWKYDRSKVESALVVDSVAKGLAFRFIADDTLDKIIRIEEQGSSEYYVFGRGQRLNELKGLYITTSNGPGIGPDLHVIKD